MENLKGNLSRTLTGAQLAKVYIALDDEARPYEANVRKVINNKRLISMRIRPEDKMYFQDLIKTACDEAKV